MVGRAQMMILSFSADAERARAMEQRCPGVERRVWDTFSDAQRWPRSRAVLPFGTESCCV